MKNAIIIGIGSVLGIFTFFIFAYIVLIIYINWPDDITIAKHLKVTQEWSEVAIDPAVTPAKSVQEIYLRIDNFKDDRNSNNLQIKLPDGKIIEPEVEIYDEYGNKFEMHHAGFVIKWYDDIVFSPGPDPKRHTKLPADRKYTRIRIRSVVPFACDQIYWRDYNLE